MTDDLLKAATRALREESADEGADGRSTRARVMASLHQGTVKRRTRLAFILPIAACLAGGTAWGAATGRLPAMFHAIGQVVGYPSREKPPSRGTQTKPLSPKSASIAAPPPVDALPPGTRADAKPEPTKTEPVPSTKAAPATSSSGSFHDTDGDLYRLAHEAHFGSHDYSRALAGWDAYLRAAPGGRLATEARYNRAICLLRLGRDDEARRALEPFASGLMGYRQTEARELLDALAR